MSLRLKSRRVPGHTRAGLGKTPVFYGYKYDTSEEFRSKAPRRADKARADQAAMRAMKKKPFLC